MTEWMLRKLRSMHGRVDSQNIVFFLEEGILRTLLYSYKKHTYLIVLPMGNTSICLTCVPLFQATIGLVHILYTVYCIPIFYCIVYMNAILSESSCCKNVLHFISLKKVGEHLSCSVRIIQRIKCNDGAAHGFI